MSDYTELQKAAQYAAQDTIKFADEDEEMRALQQFHEEVDPETVLAVIAQIERAEMHLRVFSTVAETAVAERDQLKAENEALRKDLESHKRMLLSAACDLGAIGEALGAEMDDDGSELEGIATELRKDAERLQSATALVQKLCDSAGKQPSVATGYLHDILSALGKGEQS